MAQTEIPVFHSMLTALAQGSLAGQQQAKQENDQDDQQRQQQALQLYQLQTQRSSQERQDTATAYQPLLSNTAGLDPASRAALFGEYSKRMGGIQPPNMNALSGSFDRDSPLQSFFRPPPAPAPAPGTPGGAFPYGMPQTVGAPLGAPGAAGGIPAASAVAGTPAPVGAPAGAPTSIAPPSFRSPGGQTLTLAGVSDKERAQLGQRLASLDKQFGNTSLTPEERLAVQQRRQAINLNPQTPEEYQQTLRDVGGLETIAYSRGAGITRADNTQFDNAAKAHEQRLGRLTGANPKLGRMAAGQAAQELVSLSDMEQQFRDGGGEKATGQVIGALDGYKDDIAKIKEGLASKDPEVRRQAVTDATRITDELQSGKTPGQSLQESKDAMAVLGRLSPADAANPKKAAAALAAAGLTDIATRVEKSGVNFGGAAANRTLTELMSHAKEYANATPELQQVFADQVTGAARALGQKVTLNASDLKNMDPAALVKLQLARKELEIKGSQLEKDDLTMKIDRYRYDHLLPAQLAETQAKTAETKAHTEKLNGTGAEKGRLTQGAALHEYRAQENQAAALYQKFVGESALSTSQKYAPDQTAADMIKAKQMDANGTLLIRTDDEQQIGASKWQQWQAARNRTRNALKGMGVSFDTSGNFSMAGNKPPSGTSPTGTKPPTAAAPLADAEIQHVQKAINSGGFDQWLQSPAFQDPATRERVKRAYKQITGHDWAPAR